MDTRSKIVDASVCRGARLLTMVTGYFDPMLAWHARELERIAESGRAGGARLAVVVLPLPGELLPQSSRALLVAALRMVDYVLIAENGELDRLYAELKPAQIVRLDERDLSRRVELMENVRSRQIR